MTLYVVLDVTHLCLQTGLYAVLRVTQSTHIGLYVGLHVTPSFRLPSVPLRFRPADDPLPPSCERIPAVSTAFTAFTYMPNETF